MLSLDAMRGELAAVAAQTTKPFNVNFFCHTPPVASTERELAWRAALAPYFEELGIDPAAIPAGASRLPFSHEAADVLEAFRPPVVSFHFGLPPDDLLARVRRWGGKVLSSATTVEEARWLEARGVDAVIAQGSEAGGHRGMFLSDDLNTQVGTFALVPQIVAGGARPGHRRRRRRGREGRGSRPGPRRGWCSGRDGLSAVPRSDHEHGASRGTQGRGLGTRRSPISSPAGSRAAS